ncbi:MAG TPA: hypothetical protein VFZ59_09710 [Verrucomicrobiae bacterium]|nr:hypothetical protein [Verrucomicrobiae bacterium]
MGRWSQRRLSGGGPPALAPSSSCIQITPPAQGNGSHLTVIFAGDIDANDFNTSDWETTPGLFVPDDVTQGASNALELNFNDDIEGETSLNFNGAVTGVCSPQSVPIEIV